jgi:hypothetical protein
MSRLNNEIQEVLGRFAKEIASKFSHASPAELAEFLGNGQPQERDRRGEWWDKLTPGQRSQVGQKAARTRRRNASRAHRNAHA